MRTAASRIGLPRRAPLLGLGLALCAWALAAPAATAAGGGQPARPAWWDSQLGREPVVLPGFEPVRTSGTRVELWGRSYVWDASFLPVRIDSLGTALTGPLELVARVAGERRVLRPEHVEVTESLPDHATVVASGEPLPGLTVECVTRIEYDGVAMVTLTLTPRRPLEIGGLDSEVTVVRNQWSRMLAFGTSADPKSRTNLRFMRRETLFDADFRGAFRNVLGFPDGDRSFWWFADNAEGWIWNGDSVTEVSTQPGHFLVRQRLIGASWRIERPMRFSFNFLATPVRDLGSQWREERAVHHLPVTRENRGRFHLWWPTAFAYYVLPYSVAPPEVARLLPDDPRRVFPGLEHNRKLLQEYAASGFHRLPYFSAHCLSKFDPALRRYRAEWETEPPWVHLYGVETPCLSHRAAGYSNYLLHRFDAEIDVLGITGIYFDQGAPVDSRNPAHGEWIDSNGRRQASLDILAYREFLKRLRVLFHLKGKPGYIVAHDSNAEVIPALTFVMSTLDGEQYQQPGWIRNDDYIGSLSLDRVRSAFAGAQYGVINTWLPMLKKLNKKNPGWQGSTAQYRSYRNLMTLGLLHDIPVAPVGFPRGDYASVVGELDRFGVGRSDFVGYWRENPGARSAAPDSAVSFYRRLDRTRALLVVANLGASQRTLDLSVDPTALGLARRAGSWRVAPAGFEPLPPDGRLEVDVPGRDFRLLEIGPAD